MKELYLQDAPGTEEETPEGEEPAKPEQMEGEGEEA